MDGVVTSDGTRTPALWLCPSASMLAALATEPFPLSIISADPAIALLTLRFARPTPTHDTFDFRLAREALVAEAAATFLPRTRERWTPRPEIQRWAATIGDLAKRIAVDAEYAFPQAASVAGLLALLPELMGLAGDRAAHIRELAALWRLPNWLKNIIANLKLEPTDAIALGADAELFVIVRTAVAAAERAGCDVPVLGRTRRPDLESVPAVRLADAAPCDDPTKERLLPQLLRTAAQLRRLAPAQRTLAAEAEVRRLHTALANLRDDFDHTLRDAKLASLAELAAGAGHEINNPLAVISGNAQLLRKTESDPDRVQALDRITAHTQRISEIIRDLMAFARPSKPNTTRLSLGELVREVGKTIEAEAAPKSVVLRYDLVPGLWVQADSSQIRRCIESLLRNAVQATPKGTTVTIATLADDERVRLTIHDCGPGPDDAAIPFLFDPFFSGRSAGRGRGLGLSTAWRFALQNAGELSFTRSVNDETVFELSLPNANLVLRQTA